MFPLERNSGYTPFSDTPKKHLCLNKWELEGLVGSDGAGPRLHAISLGGSKLLMPRGWFKTENDQHFLLPIAGWWFHTFFIFHKFSIICGIILPIDSYFSMWLQHVKPTNQIGIVSHTHFSGVANPHCSSISVDLWGSFEGATCHRGFTRWIDCGRRVLHRRHYWNVYLSW